MQITDSLFMVVVRVGGGRGVGRGGTSFIVERWVQVVYNTLRH